MTDQSPAGGGDLLFAWLTPIETHVDKKLHRPRSPVLSSPLLRAKTAIRRTFSAGQRTQRHKQQGQSNPGGGWALQPSAKRSNPASSHQLIMQPSSAMLTNIGPDCLAGLLTR